MKKTKPFALSRSRTMPFGSSASNKENTSGISMERLQRCREQAEKAIVDRKIFTIHGCYPSLREILRRRGWVEKFHKMESAPATGAVKKPKRSVKKKAGQASDDSSASSDDDDDDDYGTEKPWEEDDGVYGIMSRVVKNHPATFIWTTKLSSIDYKGLMKDQIVNHFPKAACLTTKNGLCNNMKNLIWYENCDPNTFFPRCYILTTEEEKQDFIDDYRITACMSLLKWYTEEYRPPSPPKPAPVSPDAAATEPATRAVSTNSSRITMDLSEQVNNLGESQQDVVKASGTGDSKPEATQAPFEVSGKTIDLAVEQCERFLRERDHSFLDSLDTDYNTQTSTDTVSQSFQFNFGGLTESAWNALLDNHTKIVANHRNVTFFHPPRYSRAHCKTLGDRMSQHWPQYHLDGWRNVWIVKPGAKSRGRGIQCYASLTEMLKLVQSSAMMQSGKYVVQKYIERPLLVYGTKFDIRQWFVVTDWNPLTMYFYRDCYLRFCTKLFTLDDLNEAIHLSNNSIQANYDNDRNRSRKLPSTNMWTDTDFRSYLTNDLGFPPNVWEDIIYPGMKNAVIYTLEACQNNVECRKNTFELFGADFMLTEDLQPWLIEVNCSPCLAPSTAVTARMCPRVVEDTLRIVLDRPRAAAGRDATIGRFELACRQPLVNCPNYLGLNLSVEGQTIKRPRNLPPPTKDDSTPVMTVNHSSSINQNTSKSTASLYSHVTTKLTSRDPPVDMSKSNGKITPTNCQSAPKKHQKTKAATMRMRHPYSNSISASTTPYATLNPPVNRLAKRRDERNKIGSRPALSRSPRPDTPVNSDSNPTTPTPKSSRQHTAPPSDMLTIDELITRSLAEAASNNVGSSTVPGSIPTYRQPGTYNVNLHPMMSPYNPPRLATKQLVFQYDNAFAAAAANLRPVRPSHTRQPQAAIGGVARQHAAILGGHQDGTKRAIGLTQVLGPSASVLPAEPRLGVPRRVRQKQTRAVLADLRQTLPFRRPFIELPPPPAQRLK